MNKYFDAIEVDNFLETLDYVNRTYQKRTDYLEAQFDRFVGNDRHKGKDADAAKLLVNEREIGFLSDVRYLNRKLYKLYAHSKNEFHNMVDSSLDAKMDIESLRKIEKDFKQYAQKHSEHGENIEQTARYLQTHYGHIGSFTQPSFEEGRENLREFCGGDRENAGFINDVIIKFNKYDQEEKNYIRSSGFEEEVDELNDRMQKTAAGLTGGVFGAPDYIRYSQFRVGLWFNYIYHNGMTKEEAENLCLLVDFVRDNFDFSEEELELLAKYYPDVIKELNKASDKEAEKIFSDMKRNISYLLDAHSLVEQYDLTEEQKEAVYNLENMIGHKYGTVEYDFTRVAGLEVVAATLLEADYSMEFVSAVLGNCCAEHCIGGIEDSNYSEENISKKGKYLYDIENYFSGRKLNYATDYADELVYELNDGKLFLKTLDLYSDHVIDENGTSIVGIGTCQWTNIDRLPGLITQYKIEMGIDEDKPFNRNITFIEAAKAESKYILIELDGDRGDYSSADEAVNKISFDAEYLNNEDEIRNAAGEFFDYYEGGDPDSEPDRGRNAWNIYRIMNGGEL